MKDYTEIVFILDRSGSMAGLESDTIGGYNSVLQRNKERDGASVVSTLLFDDRVEVICDRKNIRDVKPLTRKQYRVRGCTALLDAVGGAIEHVTFVQKTLPKHHRAKNVIFVITTDGYENTSRTFSYEKVKDLIEKKTKKGWEFIFMGANIDAAAEAARIGIAPDHAAQYFADSTGTQAVFGAIDQALCQMSADACITGSWKQEIEEDMARRD